MEERASDIVQELALLHTLTGADYSRQVERLAHRNEFQPLESKSVFIDRYLACSTTFFRFFKKNYER